MEQLFDLAKEAMEEPTISLETYEKAQEAIAVLSEYYGSKDWKQDYADDEAGLLPKDLKRGVYPKTDYGIFSPTGRKRGHGQSLVNSRHDTAFASVIAELTKVDALPSA